MEMTTKIIKFARAKKGTPCIWESSRKFPNMKRITIVFDENGDRVEAIFNRIGSNASLVPIRNEYLLLKVFFDKDGNGVTILRILNIDPYSNRAEVEVVRRKPSGEDTWNMNESSKNISEDIFIKIKIILDKILNGEE